MSNSLKVDGFKKLKEIFYIEFWIVLMINLITMFLAYLINGVEGVEKIVYSLTDLYEKHNLIAISICFAIAMILYFFFYFFDLKVKVIIKEISEGLIDTPVALFRLTAGILIAFTILHLYVDGYRHRLLYFLLNSFFCIIITTGIVALKKHIFSRPVRPFK